MSPNNEVMPLEFEHDQLPGRIVFGAGRRHDAPGEITALRPSRVLFVSGSHDTNTTEELASALERPTETIVGVRAHVPAESVHDALAVFDRLEPNVVVTVGGGSATGLGKMIARERDVTLVALPTTYAGSEMTPIWGVTQDGAKQTGRSLRVLPSVVIYDPELTLGLPNTVTVNSAFNALAHCVEALWLERTSPIAAEAAISAIRSIVVGVEDVASQLDNIEARARLLYGAHRAGSVLASAGTGMLHKTVHVLGGMFGLDHGAMYAVLTPHMVSHHLDAAPAARSRLTEALGPDPKAALDGLSIRLGAARSMAGIGFPPARLQEAAEAVAHHAGVEFADIERVLAAALTPTSAKESR